MSLKLCLYILLIYYQHLENFFHILALIPYEHSR
jgi:hypothetical protein